LTENEGIPSCRIDVIVNGIDTEKYAFSQSIRSSVRAELNVSGDQYLVMMVARLDPVKDHLTAMRACARAATVTPGLRLVLVGDGPQRGSIEKYILDNRLGDIVRILGTRPDVQRLLTAADTLLLTSVSEGIPLTIIEGMATGLPVISTNVGSVADVVMEGVTGLLAKPGDDESLAKHLTTLGRSPSLRSTMGVRGRERAISEFSETKMAESYAAVFEAALRSDSVRLLRSAKC